MPVEDKSQGRLSRAFNSAAGKALSKIDYYLTNYPSKTAASAGLIGDMLFGAQCWNAGNNLGLGAAIVGTYASYHLIRYGDPKITVEQRESYIDPQDKRSIGSWITKPHEYPWEFFGLVRMGAMGAMLGGGIAGKSLGEISYSAFALAGYMVKMGVAEKAKGTVDVPEDANFFKRQSYRLKAFVQENPNPTTGILWNAGLALYTAEAIARQDVLKFGSAVFYFLPNTFTMISSKRAQMLPSKDESGPTPPNVS